ncbi:Chromosome segregation ATPase [Geosmithia morbida]|uniref:Chromosome segregation ATPase n=1 Tax=Geosmithia morbida TaxID=1094350 RepID=A0A9P4YQ70_9HYPO|nr:Chromosome segregation ATPase [Geosmithia morbida]KAF4120010.1 Chromosome segregation ATPase [Geosmithia morbida]
MADAEEKARQEKIAAAKKRVEAMKKKTKKSGSSKKSKTESSTEAGAAAADSPDAPATTEPAAETAETGDQAVVDDEKTGDPSSPTDTPSLAQQSKLRSASFRADADASPASPGALSPDGGSGDTAPDIYRKHVARIEELEKDIKRLTKEWTDADKRWQKAEAELADLREAEGEGSKGADDDTEKLKSEIASLQRQNTQLQQQVSRVTGHRASASIASPPADLQAQLDSKSSTIESMELEIAKLKARVERQESGALSEKEQVTALEDKWAEAEAAASKAERELQDLTAKLESATSAQSTAEAKVQRLEKELAEANAAKDELAKKVDGLEKKAATLTTLHREQDTRSQALRRELSDAKAQSDRLESENAKLRGRKSTEVGGGGLDDEVVDELEDEERLRLEKKIRELEAEIHELRSGAWIEKRRELEVTSPGFQDIDLSASVGAAGNSGQNKRQSYGGAGGRFGEFFTNGLNALAGTGGGDDDGFLDDDDADFDEAYRKAQEEETQRRLERVKEIKRSLKHWEGWRLDIVDMRRGGGVEAVGEIFDI